MPPNFLLSRGKVLFAADDGVVGSELWILDPGATAQAVGVGCSGVQRPTTTATDPVLGQTMVVRGTAARGSAGALLLASPSPPIVLAAAPQCALYLDPGTLAILAPVAAPNGTWSVNIPLPNIGVLVGVPAMLQAVLTPSTLPIGADLTNGVRLTLGF